MNATVQDYCKEAGVEFTRCRPYRKNDQAWVEQKNGAIVRHTVGYRRYEGLDAAGALATLYRSLRLYVNFFQPSFKLAEKSRDGARVKKRYHAPATPYQRLVADPRTGEEVRVRVEAVYATLDPVRLLSEIRAGQQRLVEIADRLIMGEATVPTAPTLEQFLSGLRTAWQEGEVRPTSRAKEKAKRGRRRPDPFELSTVQVREWFDAEPWRTSRELFERLQGEHPGVYPDGQVRTLQRRLKRWPTSWSSAWRPHPRCRRWMCRRMWPSESPGPVAFWPDASRGFMDNASALPTTPPAQPQQQEEDWSYLKGKPTRFREQIA